MAKATTRSTNTPRKLVMWWCHIHGKTWQPEPCGTFTVKLVGNGDKMLYPAYIHVGDDQHAHGVTIPDFPGCFSAADDWEDLPRMIQEAAEVYFEGEDIPVPAPTSLEQLTANPEYQGGVWLLVDIDLAKLKVKAKRVNITMSENLLQEIDRYAVQYHMTRSGLLAQAAGQYIHRKQAA
ncbi:MAG: type II toxin-antitoxin system HicB family antitoxin [Geobacteraceae bacterium]|nr:type II toxin-antitoxin system HicB family antitoxin [Geobacteraceae bacterium]